MNQLTEQIAQTINQLFISRGVKAKVVKAVEGLRICTYYVALDLSEKVSHVKSLEEDLALRIKSIGPPLIKIGTGKDVGYVVIEATITDEPIKVPLLDVLKEVPLDRYEIPLVIGRDMYANPIALDLNECPHLLIGGTTGSGKSVLLKTIIQSMMAKYDHFESGLELVLIDPKGSELAEFKDCPQTIAYQTNYEDTLLRIHQAIDYMEDRYKLMGLMGVSDIKELRKISDSKDPYVVFVIDELSDLLLQDRKKILETALTRLIQKSRAAGIHIIAATQNPKREVVSGLIKANMPTVIALKTTSPIESRIILDYEGAERLIGKGDLLLRHNGHITRIQGALSERMTFSKDGAMSNIVDFYKKIPSYRKTPRVSKDDR